MVDETQRDTGHAHRRPLTYGKSGQRFVATMVTALGIDGTNAWLAGVGSDKRAFVGSQVKCPFCRSFREAL